MEDQNLGQHRRRLVKIGKFLSLVLRHQPEKIGLTLDSEGWACVSEVLKNSPPNLAITRELLNEVVATNNKQRYKLSADGTKIRANQGHSIAVDLSLKPQAPPAKLFHGTATNSLDSIMDQGLLPHRRNHVHLSSEHEPAVRVGQRHGKPVVLSVDSQSMHKQGFEFFRAENAVWLTLVVPPRFLRVIE